MFIVCCSISKIPRYCLGVELFYFIYTLRGICSQHNYNSLANNNDLVYVLQNT